MTNIDAASDHRQQTEGWRRPFRRVGQRWVERLAEACVFESAEASTAALQVAQADETANVVLDVYAVDVVARGGTLKPVKLREAIRAQGPTVHPEHGKPLKAAKDR